MSDEESRQKIIGIDPGAVTRLLPPRESCGPTCHEGANTNLEWLTAERERLLSKGDVTWIAAHGGCVYLTRTPQEGREQ